MVDGLNDASWHKEVPFGCASDETMHDLDVSDLDIAEANIQWSSDSVSDSDWYSVNHFTVFIKNKTNAGWLLNA